MTDHLTKTEALEFALLSAARGVPAFPIALSWNESKGKTDKRPLTPHGHHDGSTDRDKVARLFSDAMPLRSGEVYGYGQCPGPAGLVVIDADQHPGGADGVAYARDVLRLPPHTYTVATAAGGGRHYWYRKRDKAVTLDRCTAWEKHGVDVRSDDGWVVGVGTVTPWGSWTEAPGSPAWKSFATLPQDKWDVIAGVGNGGKTGSSTGTWHRYDPAKHDALLHPATLKALEIVRAEGADVLAFRDRPDGEPYLDISCDGSAISATLGYLGPAILYVFSSGWPNRETKTAYDLGLQAWEEALDGEDERPDPFELEVRAEARRLRVLEAARDRVRAERQPPAPPFDAALLEVMAAAPEHPRWRIEGLLPMDGNATVVAQRKTGKTTLMMNLARCLLTGEDFLGSHSVDPIDGTVAFLNFEVSGHQIARWALDNGVPADRLLLVNLRGRRNPFSNDDDTIALAELLRGHEVGALLVDPFGRAFTGVKQNDPGEVGAWLSSLDRFAADAGASSTILAVHAGWDRERSRGATALEDWPDVIVNLTRDDESGYRFLRALGRDVEVDEDRLDFDPVSRKLVMANIGSRKAVKDANRMEELVAAVVQIVNAHPDGLGSAELDERLRAAGLAPDRGDGSKAARVAEASRLIVRQRHGRKVMHYPLGHTSEPSVTLPHGASDHSAASYKGSGMVTDDSVATLPQALSLLDAAGLVGEVAS